ncbi:MAG: 4-(cytidine 5'-diphospho)-2-C-methyl-D-erythritol kinase [Ktedonobacteraceae bacterium]|nr:4-(cytidine 5'-diphospho)-2-C-methyl-D-erythritol kinase [Ktedonobacteraceae bacterium]
MSLSQYALDAPGRGGKTLFVRSYAKINLTLDVLGKRPDGYHELATIMQTIDLYDTLCLTAIPEDGVRMICSQPELNGDDNLAARAAQALRRRCSLTQGVMIELHKRIPVAAGLGGGSSNAAAVLQALRDWWRLPLSSTDMLDIAGSLGSDVPFFLVGGTALCEGRGERVTALPPHWPASMRWLLLVKPAIGVSTAEVYRHLSSSDYTDGTHSRAVVAALHHREELRVEDLHNGLERGVLERYPAVAQAREAVLQAGASFVRLSGSGPTLFAPFADLERAARIQRHLHTQGYEVYLTHAVYPGNTPAIFY